MCLHINREGFGFAGGYKQKGYAKFPDEISLSKYLLYDGNGGDIKYKLISVIEHLGNLNSGHFLAYKKVDWSKDKWVSMSDERVLFCPKEIVDKAEAYMLFYQQINSS